MSLSVGVVDINYLEQPNQPVYGFLQTLMENPDVGIGGDVDDEGYWGDGWDGNAFYEFYRDGLIDRADGWATEKALSSAERATLLNWIENLPYRGDSIMLHLSN